MTSTINYGNITKALDFYESLGYKYIEVPWLVDTTAYDITSPPDCREAVLWDRRLVASAEQSFLQMMLDKTCPEDQLLMASTPCFRGEPVGPLNQEWFFKVELFTANSGRWSNWYHLETANTHLKSAEQFFSKVLKIPVEVVSTSPESWDLLDTKNGIELGSYGFREHGSAGRWSYGTGCAEPRASTVQRLLRDTK